MKNGRIERQMIDPIDQSRARKIQKDAAEALDDSVPRGQRSNRALDPSSRGRLHLPRMFLKTGFFGS
jgi:hypothetical protein